MLTTIRLLVFFVKRRRRELAISVMPFSTRRSGIESSSDSQTDASRMSYLARSGGAAEEGEREAVDLAPERHADPRLALRAGLDQYASVDRST